MFIKDLTEYKGIINSRFNSFYQKITFQLAYCIMSKKFEKFSFISTQ